MKSDGYIEDVPTRAGLKQLKSFDLFEGFDDELVDDYRDFMSWFFQRDHAMLNTIPVKESTGFFINEFEESAFNTGDFQKDKPKFDGYGYRIKKILERVSDLAIQHSCITDESGRDNVKRQCRAVVEVEFLLDALKAQEKGDRIKFNRLMWHIKQCADVWAGWNPA
jgi:hypothetical protein